MKFYKIMKHSNSVNTKLTVILLALVVAMPATSQAQRKAKKRKGEKAQS